MTIFGNLDAAQQQLYESNPSLAFQQLMGWYGRGNPNFASTTLGRYIQAQMDHMNNDYLVKSGQQQADWAGQKSAWDAQQQANLAKYNSDLAAAQQQYLNLGGQYDQATRAYNAALGNSGNGQTMLPNPMSTDLWRNFQAATKTYNDLQANPYKVQDWTNPNAGNQLTWTKYLDANGTGLGQQFGFLTASQRGANPGAFEVRRNLW